jgi:hypothetical protein
MPRPQYTLYLSHSWLAAHVDINIAVWDHLWRDTLLLVDDNQDPVPPFYVSRLEHLIRRSDMFMAILPPPSPAAPEAGGSPVRAGGPAVSPYVLFEVSLARRAGLPRLILNATGLVVDPPEGGSVLARDVPFDPRVPGIVSADVAGAIAEWIRAVASAGPPRPRRASERAAALLPAGSDAAFDAVSGALEAAGYAETVDLASAATDVAALDRLRAADLVVADVGDPSLWDTYGLVHAFAVPTIRLVRAPFPNAGRSLPRVLRGHVVGYQDDLLVWSELDELSRGVALRASAIRAAMTEIDLLEEGASYFARRRGAAGLPPA